MNSNKKKTSGIVITFYVFAIILLAIFAFSVYNTYVTIADYIAGYQMTFMDGWEMFMASYFQACVPPFVGALLCYGVACILTKLDTTQQALFSIVEDAVVADVEEDELFDIPKKVETVVEETIAEETIAEEIKEAIIEDSEEKNA